MILHPGGSCTAVCPGMLILVAWNITENAFGPTTEYRAEVVQGLGADGPVFPELVQGGTGDIIMVDQGVSGFF